MAIFHELSIAARRWRQVRTQPASKYLAHSEFAQSCERLLARVASDAIAHHAIYYLPSTERPWFDTGLDLAAGERVTLICAGRVFLSEPLDLWVGPQFQLWTRVGEAGRIFNNEGNGNSFVIEQAGRLYFAGALPGQWGDETGRLAPGDNDSSALKGGISILVIRWRTSIESGLEAVLEQGDVAALFAEERARLKRNPATPAGWDYLWFLGRSTIFQQGQAHDRDCIQCRTRENVGILQKPASLPLTPSTTLAWDWKIDALPSDLPEDSALSHDYMSIAVEFNNGRDITYYWSRELPVGKGYWCPLPAWKDREFHIVIRSGAQDLGRWVRDERNLFEDYRRYIGAPPSRIVRVWLIAVSLFQRKEGVSSYANIQVADGDVVTRIL